MESRDLLTDAFGRIQEIVLQSVVDLGAAELAFRPEPGANSIAWLIWHLTRVQDDHVAEIAGHEQVWITGTWWERFGMEPDPANTGYGHTSDQVGAVLPEGPELLVDYHDAVSSATFACLSGVDGDELDRIIDESYDPPVSVGVRLVSVISDNLQHAGQARYLRGMIGRIPV